MKHLPLAVGGFVLLFVIRFWVVRAFHLIQGYRRVPRIVPETEIELPASVPLISVIVPGHNEQAVIAECLQSVLDQDYPRFELIFVDDRSQDRTASIARSLVEEHPNAKVISIEELPPGWTGKCYALDTGVAHASGEWLAFLDADSKLHGSALSQCYREAVRLNVNMITLSPRFVMNSFWEKALQPAFAAMSCMLFPLGQVNDPNSEVATANGMFYLISRFAYQQIGGHHDVKGLAVEDIGIGKRVKACGLGLVFANGREVLQTRMYTRFSDIINGWTRILSASMNYEISTVVKWLIIHILMSVPVFVAAMAMYVPGAMAIWPNGWYALPVVCGILMTLVPYFFFREMGVPSKYTILLCVGQLMQIWVFAVIVKRILCKDALQWRGTTYDTNRYQPTRLDPIESNVYAASNRPTALEKAS
ncbi:MAG: glycosyltransferase [Deltaproteobacteria bacterium]|nr:glycosyltransferase [Deltaproteobacteria bacterium]